MSMEIYIFGLVGITIIVTHGLIFESMREFIGKKSVFLGNLINCPMCFGFWVGLMAGAFHAMIAPPILAGIVSLVSWITFNLVDLASNVSLYCMSLIANMNSSDGEKNV